MIAVIADDFTGAAEMGGVALRHGLTAELELDFHDRAGSDVLTIDSDTRACSQRQAEQRVRSITRQCQQAGVASVFKKVDSVLRGHPIAELSALMRVADKRRGLLVPANPTLGRVVVGGHYYVDGVPLDRTDFAEDAQHPIHTSHVPTLVGSDWREPIFVIGPEERMPLRGIIIGEVSSCADLAAWAARLDATTVPAGGADFFDAILSLRYARAHSTSEEDSCRSKLFVSGSISAYSRSFRQRAEAQGIPVLRIPADLFEAAGQDHPLLDSWAADVIQALDVHDQAVVTIGQPLRQEPGLPQRLSGHLAAAVSRVLGRRDVHCLYVEGGATAAALVRNLEWRRLHVERELAPGVIRLRVASRSAPRLVIKPGSYPWPDEALRRWG